MNWIRVTERLPEAGKKVIATFVNQSGKRRTICAHHIVRWSVESDNDDCCHDEYSAEKDAYFLCEGWYENIENWGEYSSVHVCEGEITHWMPLPESPEQQATQPVVPEGYVLVRIDDLRKALGVAQIPPWSEHYKEHPQALNRLAQAAQYALLSAGKGGE